MLAFLRIALTAITGIFGAASGGAATILQTVALGLGLRFYAGLVVGLVITDNKVRAAAIQLGRDIIEAVI